MLEDMLNYICGPNIFENIYETLSVNLFSSSGAYSPILSVVRILYYAVMPVGVLMVLIYFICAVMETVSRETFTLEGFARQMIQFIVAKFVLEHGFEIMEMLFGIGMTVAAEVSRTGSTEMGGQALDTAAILTAFRDGMELLPIIEDFIIWVSLLIPYLGAWIMRISVSVICYSRVIEIYARACFAPIALSDFFHSGFQGGGWKHLKSFFAVALQGAMILLIAIIVSLLFRTITLISVDTNIFTVTGPYLTIYAAAVMAMFKSATWSKDLVGVN